MGSAKLASPYSVSVLPASVGVFAFQCPGSLLQIHFIAAVPAKEKSRKNVDFFCFRRAVFGGNPFLCKFKECHTASYPASYKYRSGAGAGVGNYRNDGSGVLKQ